MVACTLCKIRPATHLENGRSREVSPPYPVCGQCAAEMDHQERGMSPLDRKHFVAKTALPLLQS